MWKEGFHWCPSDSRSQLFLSKETRLILVGKTGSVHAILFVIGVGRFTEEEVTSVERFLTFFGSESKRHVIVIFTRKDELEKSGKSLKNFIDSNKKLKTFINESGGNYVAVNNDSTEDNEEFVQELLELVDTLVRQNGGHFTNKMYQEAESQMKKIEGIELEKMMAKKQTSDQKIIDDGVREYSQTLYGYSESQRKRLQSRKRKALQDECRKIHEREARRNARDNFDISDITWKILAGAVAAACVIGLSYATGTGGIVAGIAAAIFRLK
ncbi:GTPase IMAP family member 7-like [Haliotis rubra]|uniref:GTPase IMAP family member 7-like n=1 Tax=Haliotis rubra TaxID=36100 RepID=UPI001EE50014|nr:GTPase IMAP family member 7-like [Haliotis rubra]